jgi:hypothetical protein
MAACCHAQVIEPIQSRCAILRFVRLGDTEILSRLQWVCRQEKVPQVCKVHPSPVSATCTFRQQQCCISACVSAPASGSQVLPAGCNPRLRIKVAADSLSDLRVLNPSSYSAVWSAVWCAGGLCPRRPGGDHLHGRRRHAAGTEQSAGTLLIFVSEALPVQDAVSPPGDAKQWMMAETHPK